MKATTLILALLFSLSSLAVSERQKKRLSFEDRNIIEQIEQANSERKHCDLAAKIRNNRIVGYKVTGRNNKRNCKAKTVKIKKANFGYNMNGKTDTALEVYSACNYEMTYCQIKEGASSVVDVVSGAANYVGKAASRFGKRVSETFRANLRTEQTDLEREAFGDDEMGGVN